MDSYSFLSFFSSRGHSYKYRIVATKKRIRRKERNSMASTAVIIFFCLKTRITLIKILKKKGTYVIRVLDKKENGGSGQGLSRINHRSQFLLSFVCAVIDDSCPCAGLISVSILFSLTSSSLFFVPLYLWWWAGWREKNKGDRWPALTAFLLLLFYWGQTSTKRHLWLI